MLAQSPERDRDIEQLQTFIRNCAQAGIPSIKYNMSILGVLRTGRVPGRGDALYHQWKLSEAHPETPLTRAGVVSADAFWERITYFLDRVIPVANEYKIRMACHPQDPGVPPEGYQGVQSRARHRRRPQKIHHHPGEPLSRPELLPGNHLRRSRRSRHRKSSTSSATSARARKSSTCTSATFAAIATTSSRSIPTRATSISSKPSASTRRSATPTCSCPTTCRCRRQADPDVLQSFAFCYGYIRGAHSVAQRAGLSRATHLSVAPRMRTVKARTHLHGKDQALPWLKSGKPAFATSSSPFSLS